MSTTPNHSPAPGTPQTATKAIMPLLPALLAILYVLIDQGKHLLPDWLVLVLVALAAGIAVYSVPNKAK